MHSAQQRNPRSATSTSPEDFALKSSGERRRLERLKVGGSVRVLGPGVLVPDRRSSKGLCLSLKCCLWQRGTLKGYILCARSHWELLLWRGAGDVAVPRVRPMQFADGNGWVVLVTKSDGIGLPVWHLVTPGRPPAARQVAVKGFSLVLLTSKCAITVGDH